MTLNRIRSVRRDKRMVQKWSRKHRRVGNIQVLGKSKGVQERISLKLKTRTTNTVIIPRESLHVSQVLYREKIVETEVEWRSR